MKRFKRWLEDGTIGLVVISLVCVSTAVMLPSETHARGGEGDLCSDDYDCNSGLTCEITGVYGGFIRRCQPEAPPCSQQQQELSLWVGGAAIGLALVGTGAAAAGSALVASGYAYYFSATWGGKALVALGATSYAAKTAAAVATVGSFLIGLDCLYL